MPLKCFLMLIETKPVDSFWKEKKNCFLKPCQLVNFHISLRNVAVAYILSLNTFHVLRSPVYIGF